MSYRVQVTTTHTLTPAWVKPTQVWAKQLPLLLKEKKPWPCCQVPKIRNLALTWRAKWHVSTHNWGMRITRFLCSSDCCGHSIPVRRFLLRQRCDSIRSGIESATTRVFKNWQQKTRRYQRNRLLYCRLKISAKTKQTHFSLEACRTKSSRISPRLLT